MVKLKRLINLIRNNMLASDYLLIFLSLCLNLRHGRNKQLKLCVPTNLMACNEGCIMVGGIIFKWKDSHATRLRLTPENQKVGTGQPPINLESI